MTTAPRRRLGASDLDVYPLALGGNVFGWTADEPASFAVLDAYLEAGGNFIDSADGYSAWVPGNSGGESESIVGRWAASRGVRDEVVVATKVSQHPGFRGLAADNIRAAADASLARLGTESIDLYYAHFDDEAVPMADIVGAFSALVDAGKVRAIGISNFSPERIDEWFAVTDAEGFHRAVALQPHYNLVERGFESERRPVAERHGLGVVPYFSLAKGFLTGKYREGIDVQSARAGGAVPYLGEHGLRVLSALDQVAADRGVPQAAVALAWLRLQPTVVAPIASARTPEQVAELTASVALDLTADELAALDAASAPDAAAA